MSRTVLNAILNEMQIWLNENEREQLYHELTVYFGLIGATNEYTSPTPYQYPHNNGTPKKKGMEIPRRNTRINEV
jgi:hypothetical protein